MKETHHSNRWEMEPGWLRSSSTRPTWLWSSYSEKQLRLIELLLLIYHINIARYSIDILAFGIIIKIMCLANLCGLTTCKRHVVQGDNHMDPPPNKNPLLVVTW